MNYLLDTNAVVALLDGRPHSVTQRFRRAASQDAAVFSVSTISVFELWFGVARSTRQQQNAGRLRLFFGGAVGVVPFEVEDARIAGNLRVRLEGQGTPIGPYDLLIAAQALRSGSTLVTANKLEFARVPGLHVQDWTAGR